MAPAPAAEVRRIRAQTIKRSARISEAKTPLRSATPKLVAASKCVPPFVSIITFVPKSAAPGVPCWTK
jgi:hypothetical protein